MTKTHWAALAQLIVNYVGYAGLVPTGYVDIANAVLTAVLTGTVGHRALKVAGVVKP